MVLKKNEEVFQEFHGAKVLVTGNTGFKGCWLFTWLDSLGAQVTGLSNGVPTEPSLFQALGGDETQKTIWSDIADTATLTGHLSTDKPAFIFHLAAQAIVSKSYDDPMETWRTNTLGTVSILEAIRLSTIRDVCVVMITSDKVYRNHEWVWGYRENDELGGDDPYSASKAAAELAIRSYVNSHLFADRNIKIVSVRAGNVVGGGDWAPGRIVPDSVRAWISEKELRIRNPNSTRPWQHVLEPLSGYLLAALALKRNEVTSGESFNFGPSQKDSKTVQEVVASLSKTFGGNRKLKVEIENSRLIESSLLSLSSEKALEMLKWSSTLSFDQTMQWTGRWYARHSRGEEASILCREQIKDFSLELSSRNKWGSFLTEAVPNNFEEA